MKTGEKGGLWAGEKKRKGQEGEGKGREGFIFLACWKHSFWSRVPWFGVVDPWPVA